MAFGPTIICPEQLVVNFETKDSKNKKKQKHNVKCDILVNPVPPLENITWIIGSHVGAQFNTQAFEGSKMQPKDLVSTFAGGIRYVHACGCYEVSETSERVHACLGV